MNLASAQLLLRQFLANLRRHHRAGGKDLGQALDHDRIMACYGARRTHARRGAKRERDDGNRFKILDDIVPTRCDRHIGVAGILQRLYRSAAARPVDHPDQRQAHAMRHFLALDEFAVQRCVGRTTAHSEIIGAGHNGTAVHIAAPENEVRRAEIGQLACRVIAALAGNLANFTETAGIEQSLQPLARIKLALPVLPGEFLLAAHFFGQRLARPQLRNLCFPTHACYASAAFNWCNGGY